MSTVTIPVPEGQVDLLDPEVILRGQARGHWQYIQNAERYTAPNAAEARLAEQRLQEANQFFEEYPELLKEMHNGV